MTARTNGQAPVKPLRAEDYPVLAKLWDNPVDAVYDVRPDRAVAGTSRDILAYPDALGLWTHLALWALGILAGLALWWWLGGRT